MKRNSVTGTLKVICFLLTVPLTLIFLLLYVLTNVLGGSDGLKVAFLISSLGCLLLLAIIVLCDAVFSVIGYNRVQIKNGVIIYRGKTYNIDNNSRIIYTKISFFNILESRCSGELVLIENHNIIRLGRYFGYEIRKMKKYIPNIFIEPETII